MLVPRTCTAALSPFRLRALQSRVRRPSTTATAREWSPQICPRGAGSRDTSGVVLGGGGAAVGDGTQRDVLFISYSRDDREWVDRLLVLLTPLMESEGLTVWADPYIKVGEEWEREIEVYVSRAQAAL